MTTRLRWMIFVLLVAAVAPYFLRQSSVLKREGDAVTVVGGRFAIHFPSGWKVEPMKYGWRAQSKSGADVSVGAFLWWYPDPLDSFEKTVKKNWGQHYPGEAISCRRGVFLSGRPGIVCEMRMRNDVCDGIWKDERCSGKMRADTAFISTYAMTTGLRGFVVDTMSFESDPGVRAEVARSTASFVIDG